MIMGKRALKKRIQSLLNRVKEHKMKVRIEQSKKKPDDGLVRYWQAEIDAFEISIEKAQKRLKK